MYLDFHAHCNSGDPAEIRSFVENSEKNNTMTALSGGLHYGGHDYLPNEEVVKICKAYPQNLVPLAKIDLWDTPPDVSLIRKYVDMGVKGFKFIYPYYGYDHELYMPIYEELEKMGVPALFHTGNYRPKQCGYKVPSSDSGKYGAHPSGCHRPFFSKVESGHGTSGDSDVPFHCCGTGQASCQSLL